MTNFSLLNNTPPYGGATLAVHNRWNIKNPTLKGFRGYSTKSNSKPYCLEDSKDINKNLSSYLAGLIEGFGTIAVHDKNSTATKYRPMIIICFKKSDLPLANYLCDLTECGKVYIKPGRGYVL